MAQSGRGVGSVDVAVRGHHITDKNSVLALEVEVESRAMRSRDSRTGYCAPRWGPKHTGGDMGSLIMRSCVSYLRAG